MAKHVHSRQELTLRRSKLLLAEPPPKWLIDPAGLAEVAKDEEQLASFARLLTCFDDMQGPSLVLSPWLRAPPWMHEHLVQPWEHDISVALPRLVGCNRVSLEPRERAHRVAFVGSLADCTRCACFAHNRLGSRFEGDCQLRHGRARAAVSYRLLRLMRGRHPITGLPLER